MRPNRRRQEGGYLEGELGRPSKGRSSGKTAGNQNSYVENPPGEKLRAENGRN